MGDGTRSRRINMLYGRKHVACGSEKGARKHPVSAAPHVDHIFVIVESVQGPQGGVGFFFCIVVVLCKALPASQVLIHHKQNVQLWSLKIGQYHPFNL